MITKERLEELIEKGATIYDKYANALMLLNFEQKDDVGYYSQKTHIKNEYLVFEHIGDYDYHFEYCLEDLFETKEDAEEYAEFGDITKTTQLSYVSWEEFKNRDRNFSFRTYPYDYYCYTDGRYVEIKEYYRSSDRVIFSKKLTRENYNEARRLCVKLFKGEEV